MRTLIGIEMNSLVQKTKVCRFFMISLFLLTGQACVQAGKDLNSSTSAVDRKDSIYVSDGKWVSQSNVEMRLRDLKGTPRVVTMVFTSCPSACPLIVSDVKKIEAQLNSKAKGQVRFTLFSFDPKNDQPDALAAFAKKMKLGPQWDLFVANDADTRELAAILGIQFKQLPSGDFIHSNSMIAVDSEGRILAERKGFEEPVDQLAKALNSTVGSN